MTQTLQISDRTTIYLDETASGSGVVLTVEHGHQGANAVLMPTQVEDLIMALAKEAGLDVSIKEA